MAKTKAKRRAAGSAQAAAKRRGKRLRDLRVALGYTPSGLARASRLVAAALVEKVGRGLGDGDYAAVEASALLHMEAGRHHIGKAATRAVLAGVFGLTQDELANYLDGRMHLQEAVALTESRRSAGGAGVAL